MPFGNTPDMSSVCNTINTYDATSTLLVSSTQTCIDPIKIYSGFLIDTFFFCFAGYIIYKFIRG